MKSNYMNFKFFLLSAIMLFAASCEENTIGLKGLDGEAPSKPVLKSVENRSGAALIRFEAPTDLDLMCVAASYEVNGTKVVTKSSPYADSLFVEGFGQAGEYDIELFSIDLSGNESEREIVTINPTTPPIAMIFESLQIKEGFGGIELSWNNPTKTNIVIDVVKKDEYGDWVDLEQFFTSAPDGYGAIRGMTTDPVTVGVMIKDKWGNISPMKEETKVPLYEEKLPKDKALRTYAKVAALPGDSQPWASGYDIPDMWDNIYFDEKGNSCYHSSTMAVKECVTFDLGRMIKLSRFMFYPRGGTHRFFTHNHIKYFNIYGATELTPEMYSTDGGTNPATGRVLPDLSQWTPILLNANCWKPSGNDNPAITAEDIEWVKTYGHEFNVPLDVPPVRYIRIQFLENWSGGDIFQLGEVDFWGQLVDGE